MFPNRKPSVGLHIIKINLRNNCYSNGKNAYFQNLDYHQWLRRTKHYDQVSVKHSFKELIILSTDFPFMYNTENI